MKNDIRRIAFPIAVQNLIAFLATAVDSMMTAQISAEAFSAVSLAGQVFFIITLLVGGIAGGSNVLVSQAYGRKNYENITAVLAYTIRLAVILPGVIAVTCMVIPSWVMSLLTSDRLLISIGASYLRIVSISYLFYSITTALMQTLRAMQNVRTSMILSCISLCTNAFFNWCLIFGNCGMPALGVQGAALATVLSRGIEFILSLIYLRWFECELRLRPSQLRKTDSSIKSLYYRTCIPVISNELLWALGESVVTAMVGRMQQSVIQVYSIYNIVSEMSNILMNGINSAGCLLIGNRIGAGLEIRMYSRGLRKLSLITGIIDGLAMLCALPVSMAVNHLEGQTRILCIWILSEGAVVEIFKSMQCMNVMGILRGSGDVKFGFLNDILFLWLYTIPVVYLAIRFLDPSFQILFPIMKSDQIWKWMTSIKRIKHAEWNQKEEYASIPENK